MKKIIILITLVFIAKFSFCQCKVRTLNENQGVVRYCMSENIYSNPNYHLGVQGFYISANFYTAKTGIVNSAYTDLVITYIWSDSFMEFNPNKLIIQVEDDDEIILSSETMLRQYINGIVRTPPGMNSIEYTFSLPNDLVDLIMNEKTIIKFEIIDNSKNNSFDFSSEANLKLKKILSCIVKK